MGKLWKTYSVSFFIVVLLGGLFIGAALGSLLGQIFGLEFLHKKIFSLDIVDFYVIERLTFSPSVSSLLGFFLAGWFIFRNMKG